MKKSDKQKSEIRPSEKEEAYYDSLEKFLGKCTGTRLQQIENFPKFAPRQALSWFLTKYEMYRQIVDVQGSIVECGVHLGGGLMTFAQLSAIFEPFNHTRKVIGFDTFEGFPHLAKQDERARASVAKKGGFAITSSQYQELQEAVRLFDLNRPVGHIPKVELVKGDALETMPKYLEENPHTVVSLLYLDFDVFEPTRCAIELFLPRIPKGGMIAFDELNISDWPGETLAVMESIGIPNLKIRRFPFTTSVSYAVIE